jgi:hypothetical protein
MSKEQHVLLNWRSCKRCWKSSKRRFGHQERLIEEKEAEGLEAELKTNFVNPRQVDPVESVLESMAVHRLVIKKKFHDTQPMHSHRL